MNVSDIKLKNNLVPINTSRERILVLFQNFTFITTSVVYNYRKSFFLTQIGTFASRYNWH